MPKASAQSEHNQAARLGTILLVHTVLLALFLVQMRLEKLDWRGVDLTLLQAFQVVAGDVGLLLLVETPWFFTIRSRWGQRLWLWLSFYFLSQLPLYVLSITGHRYFAETGVIQQGSMVLYMLREFAAAAEVLKAGIDSLLFRLIGVALAIWAVVIVVAWCRVALAFAGHLAASLGFLVCGAALLFVPAKPPPGAALFGGNWLTDLLPHPARTAYQQQEVPTWVRYSEPRINTMAWRISQAETSASPPHVLLVVIESGRRDLFAAYGGTAQITPRLDELTRDAARVTDAYVAVSHTSKALVAMHCGMYPTFTMAIPETRPGGVHMGCLPRLLGALGYDSMFFQAAGNFERRATLLQNLGYRDIFVPTPQTAGTTPRRGYLGWDEEVLVEPLLEHLRSRKEPTLSTLLTLSTHHPYLIQGSMPREPQLLRESYEAAARRTDEVIGGALLRAKKEGLLENTILILTGDHGETFGRRPGFRQHDIVPYESVTHVPLFLEGPGIEPRKTISGLRSHLDLLPTLLDLLEVPYLAVLPGKNLLTTPGHEFVVSSCWYEDMCMSLRQGNLTFPFFYGVTPLEAYDVAADPLQDHNLIEQISPQVRQQVEERMLGAREAGMFNFMRGQARQEVASP